MNKTNNNQETLAKASKKLMMTSPFYGLFLMMLNKKFDKKFPSAGVSKNGINYQLIIGEDFWSNLTDDWQIGIVHHEILHIAFFHLERHSEFPDKGLANIAMDMEINQFIEEKYLPGFEGTKEDFDTKWDPIIESIKENVISGKISKEEYIKQSYKVPPRGVYLKDFPELKMEAKKGTKYYYEKLSEAKDKKKQSAGKGEDSQGGGDNTKGKGTSGSPALDGLLDQMSNSQPTVCDHESWKDFENMSEAEKKLLRSQTDFHLKEIAEQVIKSRGTIPGELKDYIDNIDKKEPPKFDWRGYLRRFTGGSTKIYTKKLHRKYNKRFDENPGLKIKQRKHILVGVDTSGSVSKEELKEFFHEIYHIRKGGTEVTIAQCDSAISNISPYKKGFEDKISIYGRGGTEFDPILNLYNENPHKYTCLVYFTDGECTTTVKPRGRTLWVLSSTSQENNDLPGQTIKLN